MRCLYCGKELALFKRLRGGEFCSDAHRLRYQEEYTQLALNRLLQANAAQDADLAEAKPKEIIPAEPESPALKRRERLGREEAPAAPLPQAPAGIAAPLESALFLEVPAQAEAPNQTAVLDPEPAPPAAFIPAFVEQAPLEEEPPPVGMSSFLVEFPLAAEVDAAAIIDSVTHLGSPPRLSLPRLQEFPREALDGSLELAGRIPLNLFSAADFQAPPRERGLELREFVHGLPQVQIRVRPASETGFEPVRHALEVPFDTHPAEDSPQLWQLSEEELPALVPTSEILLEDLARLDFATTGWEESESDDVDLEQPPSASESRAGIGSAPLEPMRVEPIQLDPAPPESWRPEPLHFEPVHLDPVFMEQVTSTAEFKAQKNDAIARETLASETAASKTMAPATVALDTVETAVAEAPVSAERAISIPTAPAPPSITKPMPVTLHGLAPARGKPVQVFTAAASRIAGIQVPRETGLPLRPTMVLTSMLKAVGGTSSNGEKTPTGRPVKSIPVPEKREPRPTEIKPRRSEVRILPVKMREDVAKRQKEQTVSPPEPVKLDQAKPEPTGKAEPVTQAPAEASKETTLKEKPAERLNPERANPVPSPVEIRTAAPLPAETKPRIAPAIASPMEEPDLLGLPKLSFQNSENFWTRLPLLARVGIVAGVLALVIGGLMLTSRGSGAPKAPVPAANTEPQVVEADSALANTAGWEQDWFADRTGSRQGRHVDVLRGSLSLHDYRLVFEGQIEQGALGWVFRANEQSFYVEKIQVISPGREPVVALVRFAVIKGKEQPRTQIPLPIHPHLDTTYKVRLDVVGDRFTTWVQDMKVDQWTDGQIGAGGVGLYYDSGDSAKLKDTLNVIPLKLK